MTDYLISFATDERFWGVVIVGKFADPDNALKAAHALGIAQPGEALCMPIPSEFSVPEKYRERLLATRAECDEACQAIFGCNGIRLGDAEDAGLSLDPSKGVVVA